MGQIRVVVGVTVALLLSVVGDRGWLGSSDMSGIAAGTAHSEDEDGWFNINDLCSSGASSCAKDQKSSP